MCIHFCNSAQPTCVKLHSRHRIFWFEPCLTPYSAYSSLPHWQPCSLSFSGQWLMDGVLQFAVVWQCHLTRSHAKKILCSKNSLAPEPPPDVHSGLTPWGSGCPLSLCCITRYMQGHTSVGSTWRGNQSPKAWLLNLACCWSRNNRRCFLFCDSTRCVVGGFC